MPRPGLQLRQAEGRNGALERNSLTSGARASICTNTGAGAAYDVDTKRTGNEIDMTTYGDRSVVGVCFCEVMYRHSHLDPRKSQPDP